MGRSREKVLVEKSIEACLAAIEIYNKPNFQYREECFSILMLNAWELLLKARIIKQNNGRTNSIEMFEKKLNKDGTKSKRKRKKLNRVGNAMTISLERAVDTVRQYNNKSIDQPCIANLNLLKEIRDNSVHFHNVSSGLGKRIQEVGSAALKNFVAACENWFDITLSRYNFYLMPLAFHTPFEIVESVQSDKHPRSVKRLLERIAAAERDNPSSSDDSFHVTLQVQLKFSRSLSTDATRVRMAPNDPNAVPVVMTEENIRENFPWDYTDLISKLKDCYIDFLQNSKFYSVKRKIESDGKYNRVRYLDPSRKNNSTKKTFYSPGILTEFDKYYTRK